MGVGGDVKPAGRSEDLAMETLGLDLTKAETWWAAIAPLEADLQAYEARL